MVQGQAQANKVVRLYLENTEQKKDWQSGSSDRAPDLTSVKALSSNISTARKKITIKITIKPPTCGSLPYSLPHS